MKKEILIVDDVAINRAILAEILEDEYTAVEAEDGEAALQKIEQYGDSFSVVLLDLMMPVRDGFYVLEGLKRKKYMDRVPVLVISGETSAESEKRCLDMGVADFIHKPFDENIVRQRITNVTELYAYKNSLEDQVARQTEELMRQNRALQKQAAQLGKYNRAIVDVLGTVVESRNMESGDHIYRVKSYTEILAKQMMRDYPEYGLTGSMIEVMASASVLHDVGKIAIPDAILLKSGGLTTEEYDEMKTHTVKGCAIIDSVEDAWDEEYKKVSYEICRYHHERYDGNGYPDRLAGDQIPIHAQIVSVADVYDALTSKRVYKDAYGKSTALQMILDGKCGVFSPKLMAALKKVKAEFEAFSD